MQVLVLDNNQLISLPTDIGQLSRLEKLSVKENALVTVPVSIKQLQKLYVLDISANSLSELTAAVAECSQLEELNVSNNDLQVRLVTTTAAITGCPQTIQDIHKVETCDVDVILMQDIHGEAICSVHMILRGNNDIVKSFFFFFLYFRNIYVSGSLQAIPSSLQQLQKVKILNFSQNKITSVPSGILTGCQALHTLLLHSNPISAQVWHDVSFTVTSL